MMSNDDNAKKNPESSVTMLEKKSDHQDVPLKEQQELSTSSTISLDDNKNKETEHEAIHAAVETNTEQKQQEQQDTSTTKTQLQQQQQRQVHVLPPPAVTLVAPKARTTASLFVGRKNFEDVRQSLIDVTRAAATANFAALANQGNNSVISNKTNLLANLLSAADDPFVVAANNNDNDSDDDDWGGLWAAASNRKNSDTKSKRSFAELTGTQSLLSKKSSTGINNIRNELRSELSRGSGNSTPSLTRVHTDDTLGSSTDTSQEMGQTRKRQKYNNNASEVGDLIVRLSSSNLLRTSPSGRLLGQSSRTCASGKVNASFGESTVNGSSASLDDWETGRKKHFGRRSRSGILSEVARM